MPVCFISFTTERQPPCSVNAEKVRAEPLDGLVCALSLAVGLAVGDEQPLEPRLDDVAQGVVHHPIIEAHCADLAPFRVLDVKMQVATWPVGSGEQPRP